MKCHAVINDLKSAQYNTALAKAWAQEGNKPGEEKLSFSSLLVVPMSIRFNVLGNEQGRSHLLRIKSLNTVLTEL